ncbi:hypothetical protein AZI85_14385 [Bdellovibrio bacteriovorus]|uniref:Uncharacterized protein n=1 Tax=Bdellovibrio bacteriovorus TaxID=959 RepID=A0A150WV50_BDEBC|nr:hypothetical protein [Bdellovibrio bacteriovorus]KYG70323.1 hypothetical protein AZI85_14385 [Bdellovibrio bacteriovorus]
MKKFLKKSLLGVILFTGPSLAEALPFCVGNFTGEKLTWNVRDPGRRTFIQDSTQEWVCDEVPYPNSSYIMEISFADHKYDIPSCEFYFSARDVIEVSAEKIGDKLTLNCFVAAYHGNNVPIKKQLAGKSLGWILVGEITPGLKTDMRILTIYDGNKKQLHSSGFSPNKNGQFIYHLSVPVLGGYIIETRQITRESELQAAFVPEGFDFQNDRIIINTATTLAVEYARTYGVDKNTAEKRVRSFFGFSDETSLSDFSLRSADTFGERIIIPQARSFGSYDGYIKKLIADMKDPKALFAPLSLSEPEWSSASLKEEFNIFSVLRATPKDFRTRGAYALMSSLRVDVIEVGKMLRETDLLMTNSMYKARYQEILNDYSALQRAIEEVEYYRQFDLVSDPFQKDRHSDEANRVYQWYKSRDAVKVLAKKLISNIYIALEPSRTSPTLDEMYEQTLRSKNYNSEDIHRIMKLYDVRFELMQSYAVQLWMDALHMDAEDYDRTHTYGAFNRSDSERLHSLVKEAFNATQKMIKRR